MSAFARRLVENDAPPAAVAAIGSAKAGAADARAWLDGFARRHGRPLRVLHIGNIANNAYNNAKIQRSRGIAADVLSHDYYHIMACPEWEDADFTGEVGDPMFPDWWAVKLGGFVRPHWFAQGPFDACIRHLLAADRGGLRAGVLWRVLQFERWLLCRRSKTNEAIHRAVKTWLNRELAYVSLPANAVALAAAGRAGARLGRALGPFGRRLARRGRRLTRWAATAEIAADSERHRRAFGKLRLRLLQLAQDLGCELREDDLLWPFLWWWHPYLRLLFDRYDIVQGYATYTALPFIVGRTDYVAYEHGTIRAIPFQDTAEGRLCATTYRGAAAVLVTNSDNLDAAERLRLDPSRVCCLPHAFDSDKLERFAREHPAEPCAPGSPTLFFTPTRQHWVDGDPGWAKGNDRVLRAAALLAGEGLSFRLRLVAWGADVEASRELAAALGIGDCLDWMPTMKKRKLWHEYLNADCVIDQFVVPAIGGVGFEAMMLGKPVITAIDKEQTKRFFGEPPPLLACQSVEEIVDAMRLVITDRERAAALGASSRDWMRRYHSADRIVDLQLDVYRRILERQNGAEGQSS